jgi:hypothetical protein
MTRGGSFVWGPDRVNMAAYDAASKAVGVRPRYIAVGHQVVDAWAGDEPEVGGDIGRALDPERTFRVARALSSPPQFSLER